jgi:hypothetical protein
VPTIPTINSKKLSGTNTYRNVRKMPELSEIMITANTLSGSVFANITYLFPERRAPRF